jgi:signal transduction histidine kinase
MTAPIVPANPAIKLLRRVGADSGYVLLGLPLAIVSFALLVPLLAVTTGTLVIVLGLPVLALALLIARGFADLERVRLQAVLGRPVPRPQYRRADPAAGLFTQMLTPIMQGQPWLDLLHGIFVLIPAIISFVFGFAWWAMALGGLTWPIWGRYIPVGDGDAVVSGLMGKDTPGNRTILYLTVGIIATLTLPFVLRAVAALHASFSSALLTSLAQLQGRIDYLTESRAAAVSAEATALRRLERDIHDGPQQRLIRLAMDLSRAQRQLDLDPSGAKETLAGAVTQTRETLDELRALSRGIAPPVLVDRGLGSALAALAARSTVPVDLEVGVAERLPEVVENTMYFVAAETLSNLAKHSGATTARVTLARRNGAVYLAIEDDGAGGAHFSKGHGLAGLVDRVRAIDGTLAVSSPLGGPTVVVAEVPCG